MGGADYQHASRARARRHRRVGPRPVFPRMRGQRAGRTAGSRAAVQHQAARSGKLARTSAAVCAGGPPARLALVAVMGRPSPATSARATRVRTSSAWPRSLGHQGRAAGPAAPAAPGSAAPASARPSAARRPRRDLPAQRAGHRPVGHDQRHHLVRRPPLQRPQPLQRGGVQGVDRQAVAALGRERDDLPARQRRQRRAEVESPVSPPGSRRPPLTARGLRRRSPAPSPGGPRARPAPAWPGRRRRAR